MSVRPVDHSLWQIIRCFFGLHPYKLIVELESGTTKSTVGGIVDVIEVPFKAYEICRVCGKVRDKITGAIADKKGF